MFGGEAFSNSVAAAPKRSGKIARPPSPKVKASGGDRGYAAKLDGLQGIEVRLVSASEIAGALFSGEVHLGVTGEDLLRELASDLRGVILVQALGFGRADLVARCAKHPLKRALRLDKLIYQALENTLRNLVLERDPEALDVLASVLEPVSFGERYDGQEWHDEDADDRGR